MRLTPAALAQHPVVRWLVVGTLFAGFGLGLIKLFYDLLHWPYWLATLLQAEITTVLRYLVNDRWVFGHRHPTWMRLWQFHVATAGGFTVWWVASNLLQRSGVHYLLAAMLGACCSVGVNLASNFFWVWRKRTVATPEVSSK
ncbi:MAG TPA: GtrA family protein [Opitutaceae bacterium]|nr:GtrA family protein [Opitutaceae bacterium]